MKEVLRWIKRIYFGLLFLSAAAAFTAATFAWFTANEKVETDLVRSRTGTAQLELEISRTNFNPDSSHEVALKQPGNVLMPVSTADLVRFAYNPMTQDGIASQFLPADESLYYHDMIFLRAKGEGFPAGTKLALYLDDEISIAETISGELLSAARLGFRFDGGSPKIIALSTENEGTGNTQLGGVMLRPGQVIRLTDGVAEAVDDPAVPLSSVLPGGQSLIDMELNKVYQIDIYFYIEGCDPDCTSEKVGLDSAALQLGFYGLLAE